MKLSDITFQEILVKDLEEFAEKEADSARSGGFIAISPWRAHSQTHNPNAIPDDKILIVAKLKDETVGYAGLMPGCIRRADGFHRVFFLSGLFTAPQVRRLGVGRAMYDRLLDADKEYLATGASESGEGFFNSLGLSMIGSFPIFRIYFGEHNIFFRIARKFSHSWLPEPVKWFAMSLSRKALFLFTRRTLDRLIDTLVDLRELDLRLVRNLSDEAMELRDCSNRVDLFWRSGKTINWMLNSPWVVPRRKVNSKIQDAYYFSSVRDDFYYLPYELYWNGKMEGFAVFSFSVMGCGGNLKLLDYELPNRLVMAISIREALRLKASTLEVPCELAAFSQGTNLRGLSQVEERPYYARPAINSSKMIGNCLPNILFSATDSDLAFV